MSAHGVGEHNIKLVRDLHEAVIGEGFEEFRQAILKARNWDEAVSPMSDDLKPLVERVDPEVEIDSRHFPLPFGKGHWVGREQWLDFWRTWLEPWEKFDYRVSHFESAGEDVLMDISITARGQGSQVPVEWDLSQIWTVRGGRIVRMCPYANRADALAALRDTSRSDSDPQGAE